jgi:hypothetical protein
MRRLALIAVSAAAGLYLAVGALGLTPGRTRTETAPIVALSVTGRSVTYAVADNAKLTDCAHVYFWHTAGGAIGKWRFGKPTREPCSERPSTGDGISAVAMSDERSLWIQYAGGNLRDWQLFTATRTKTRPRQLAFVEQDVELPPPIVIGQGAPFGVPYAVNADLTLLGDNGAAMFKWMAPSPVRLLAAGSGPGGAVVAAFLDSGTLDLLSRTGTVLQSYAYSPGEVTALFLSPNGIVFQDGSSVLIREGATVTTTVALPAGARMIGYGNQEQIFYSLKGAIHTLRTTTLTDATLVAATPGKTTIASYATAGGFAWSTGNKINWDCAVCVNYGGP